MSHRTLVAFSTKCRRYLQLKNALDLLGKNNTAGNVLNFASFNKFYHYYYLLFIIKATSEIIKRFNSELCGLSYRSKNSSEASSSKKSLWRLGWPFVNRDQNVAEHKRSTILSSLWLKSSKFMLCNLKIEFLVIEKKTHERKPGKSMELLKRDIKKTFSPHFVVMTWLKNEHFCLRPSAKDQGNT